MLFYSISINDYLFSSGSEGKLTLSKGLVIALLHTKAHRLGSQSY